MLKILTPEEQKQAFNPCPKHGESCPTYEDSLCQAQLQADAREFKKFLADHKVTSCEFTYFIISKDLAELDKEGK
jgi:hypothetical protein